ncbi:MAG: redoxin domain-containing protein [Armatimonadetes bacterium]|nr:redoxin domain-containing protein [Armatimonadota bacterium]MBX3108124.1 redoxin domain-containing protein [Fimbriimonadaceae bacterium]
MLPMICAFCAVTCADGLPSTPVSLTGAADLTGKPTAPNPAAAKATVLLFISHECPIANRYAPEIARIYADYKDRKAAFYRVYIGAMEDAELYAEHGKEFGLAMPGLVDFNLKLAKSTGATVTPEAVVLDSKGVMRYRGRIDDQNVEHGKIREGYRRDLRIALDEILAGQPVSMPTTASVGCFIPF